MPADVQMASQAAIPRVSECQSQKPVSPAKCQEYQRLVSARRSQPEDQSLYVPFSLPSRPQPSEATRLSTIRQDCTQQILQRQLCIDRWRMHVRSVVGVQANVTVSLALSVEQRALQAAEREALCTRLHQRRTCCICHRRC